MNTRRNSYTTKTIAISMVLLIALAGCQSNPAMVNPMTDKDLELKRIIQSFTGIYSGIVPDLTARKESGSSSTMAIFQQVYEVDAPQFGDTVIYHRMSRDSLGGPVLQQKIYAFDTSPNRPNNRMQSYYVLTDSDKAKLQNGKAGVKDLDPKTLMSFPPQCIINWAQVKEQFIARVKKEDCAYQSAMYKKEVRPDMTYTIDNKAFNLLEAMYTKDGDIIFTMEHPISATRIPQ